MNDQPKKEHKRYTEEKEILEAIDAARKKAAEFEKEADGFDSLKLTAARKAANEEQKEGDAFCAQFWRDQMEEYKQKGDKCRQQANRIHNVRLRSLGEKLAELRTEVMNFMGGDGSVAA
jgi:hypothetical protein